MNALGGCEQYPCDKGFGCTYQQYSLVCVACPDNSLTDGISCTPCPAGQGPNNDRSACIDCAGRNYSISGVCQECSDVVNADRTSCSKCPLLQTPSANGEMCECDSNSYSATSGQIACHEDDLRVPTAMLVPCLPCGPCIDCTGSPKVRPEYVRVNLPQRSMSSGRRQLANQSHTNRVDIFRCKAETGCFGLTSAEGTSDVMSGCRPNHVGYFCQTCDADFVMERNSSIETSEFSCIPCDEATTGERWVVGLAVLATAGISFAVRKRVIRLFTEDPLLIQAILAATRSCWQPIRILITYAQVTQQMSSVLNVRFPKRFLTAVEGLSDMMNFIDVFSGKKCWGLDGFHPIWLAQVVFLPLALFSIALLVFAAERFQANKAGAPTTTAAAHLFSNIFFVVFFCYPRTRFVQYAYNCFRMIWWHNWNGFLSRSSNYTLLYTMLGGAGICSSAFRAFVCRSVQLDPAPASVLVDDDRVLCQDDTHVLFQWLSMLVVVLVAFGVPVSSAALLYRERRKQLQTPIPEQHKLLVAGALGVSVESAAGAYYDVKLGSKFGFITGCYKPQYYMWESIGTPSGQCVRSSTSSSLI
eukprot:COSAG06_NODE_4358_length_4332_cov_1.458540_2_plen_585_part_00